MGILAEARREHGHSGVLGVGATALHTDSLACKGSLTLHGLFWSLKLMLAGPQLRVHPVCLQSRQAGVKTIRRVKLRKGGICG